MNRAAIYINQIKSDIDKKVQILFRINSLIPKMCRINIPSLITDYRAYSMTKWEC